MRNFPLIVSGMFTAAACEVQTGHGGIVLIGVAVVAVGKNMVRPLKVARKRKKQLAAAAAEHRSWYKFRSDSQPYTLK